MTPFAQTSVRTTTIRHHTERGTATTAHNARLRRELPSRPALECARVVSDAEAKRLFSACRKTPGNGADVPGPPECRVRGRGAAFAVPAMPAVSDVGDRP